MPINSKRKGAKGERELAKVLRGYGYSEARRTQQYCGDNGDADLVGLPNIHIECKRVEKLNIYDAIDQAKSNSGKNELPFDYPLPAVFHRRNDHEWLVTMCLDDWMRLYKGGLSNE
jgi:hypothetical protein